MELKKVTIFIFAIIVFSIGIRLVINTGDISVTRFLPIFLTGTLLSIYEVILEKEKQLSLFKSKKLEYAGLLCFVLIIISFPVFTGNLFLHGKVIEYTGNSTTFFPYAIAWSIVLIATKYGDLNILRRFFELWFFRFLGVISFSAYLFHALVILFVYKDQAIPSAVKFYAFLGSIMLLSFLTYIFIERPLQKIKIKY